MGVACATSGRGSCGHTKAVAGYGGQQERADQTRFETRRDTSRVRPAQDVPRHTQGWILVHHLSFPNNGALFYQSQKKSASPVEVILT